MVAENDYGGDVKARTSVRASLCKYYKKVTPETELNQRKTQVRRGTWGGVSKGRKSVDIWARLLDIAVKFNYT
jgi:hypothetical protein